ncbi:hypothetical protein TNCV_3658571 [Trichonephila clavipes]|nr:hypothetical protein TNCV_3658571 [Trichonephila clavipes]
MTPHTITRVVGVVCRCTEKAGLSPTEPLHAHSTFGCSLTPLNAAPLQTRQRRVSAYGSTCNELSDSNCLSARCLAIVRIYTEAHTEYTALVCMADKSAETGKCHDNVIYWNPWLGEISGDWIPGKRKEL